MDKKLSKYAKDQGITYQTALVWYQKGLIEGAYKTPSGSIFVKEVNQNKVNPRIVIYARVSNQSRKEEMEYQVERLETYAASKGYSVSKVYKEVASGMNDSRKQLWKMIESKPTVIVIENKDRLTRFGYEYLSKLLSKLGTEIDCVNINVSEEKDLIQDLVSIVTSFCCRLYGLRRGKNKSKKIEEEIINDSEQ